MAEAGGTFDIRRMMLVVGVVAVISISIVFFLYRGCVSTAGRYAGYTQIYSNLDLKDAATTVARLKELGIPYEIREEGRAVAVPKDRADQARLGLAEKNLPVGGMVGWEIFDESKLGATDFDRRIQLIRAISGELSRTIRRIAGVEDARVQVVIPETKLFSATTAPVTASVLLRLNPGFELSRTKIAGIVHLVASSVENLQPENVTVIDESGTILTAREAEDEDSNISIIPPPPAREIPSLSTTAETIVLTKEASSPAAAENLAPVETKLAEKKPVSAAPASPLPVVVTIEEKILQRANDRKKIEKELSGKAQELINRFYPPNSAIVKVKAEFKPITAKDLSPGNLRIKNLKVIVLIDNRLDFTKELKKSTFSTIAGAIGYDKKRGDRILIQKVPFHLATISSEAASASMADEQLKKERKRHVWWMAVDLIKKLFWPALIILLIAFAVYRWISMRQIREEVLLEKEETAPVPMGPPPPRQQSGALNQIKSIADNNPERIAEMLKKWLSE